MLTWIILILIVAVIGAAIVIFNRLVHVRQMANEAWSGIDVQLKRRAELVPNLVEAVKGYAAHESRVLDEVTKLRGQAASLSRDDVAQRAQAEGALSIALGKLIALAESYPDLKASTNFLDLQQQLSTLENELQMARRYYNGAVRNQNVLVQSFPSQPDRRCIRLSRAAVFRAVERSRARRAAGVAGKAPMIARVIKAVALAAGLLATAAAARAEEAILSFDLQVKLAKDGELTVAERIRVRAEGRSIRRGIFRDFPLTFHRRRRQAARGRLHARRRHA